MSTLKKIIISTIFFAYSTVTLSCCSAKVIHNTLTPSPNLPIDAGVLFYDFNDIFLMEIRKQLKAIEEKNSDKIKFSFFDGKNNPDIQTQIVDNLIQKKVNLLVLNLSEGKESLIEELIYKAKQKSIPVILFNSPPTNINILEIYKKSILIRSDAPQSGLLEGKILVDKWNTDKNSVDKNHDNIMQYVMLQGNPTSDQTSIRTRTSLEAINNAGIKTEEIATVICNWNKELARETIESLFLRFGPKIEVIIANNDAMAIGAVEALQKYGYNTGNKLKTIQVVGIDALPEAQALIKKGFMLGSVTQDTQALAEAIYTIGMNLVFDKNPLEGTNYKLDDTGVIIIIPLKEYISDFTNVTILDISTLLSNLNFKFIAST